MTQPGSRHLRRIALPTLLAFAVHHVPPALAQSNSDSATDSQPSTDSTAASGVSSVVALGVAVVIAAVVVAVVLTSKNKPPRPHERRIAGGDDGARGLGAALLAQGLVQADGALAKGLARLIESPSAMDALTAEAARGGGPSADALARAAGLPTATVVAAWNATAPQASPATSEAAFARVVRFLEAIGPELGADRALAGALLWDLAQEQARPDFPADAPVHARVAGWTGLSVEQVAPVVTDVLADEGAPRRAWLYTHADEVIDALGAELGARWPAEVASHADALQGRAVELGFERERMGLASR